MKDLIQCTAARDDFKRWLAWGNAPLTIYEGKEAVTMLLKIEKSRLTICTKLPWKQMAVSLGKTAWRFAVYMTSKTAHCI